MTDDFAFRKGKPRTFYRGTNPGDERRIRTGDSDWDNHLFASSKEDSAKNYGSHITKYEAEPDAKILYHGTKEYRSVAKGVKGNMLETSSEIAKRAKAAGYHAVHFERQGDVGTAIFDKNKFKEVKD